MSRLIIIISFFSHPILFIAMVVGICKLVFPKILIMFEWIVNFCLYGLGLFFVLLLLVGVLEIPNDIKEKGFRNWAKIPLFGFMCAAILVPLMSLYDMPPLILVKAGAAAVTLPFAVNTYLESVL